MDALQDLLDEIHRIQCLVCACRRRPSGPDGELATGEMLEVLRLSPAECGRVVRSLTADGLFEPVPDPVHPLPRAIRLTDSGREYLRKWSSSLPARHAGR